MGFTLVVGVDLSQKLLDLARKENPDIDFVCADFLQLPFDNSSFSGIWASASLVHLETKTQVKQALLEFKRVLKKSGVVYIRVQNRGEQKDGWVKDVHSKEGRFFQFFRQGQLEQLVEESGLRIIDSFTRESSRPGIEWVVVFAEKI